VATVVDHFQQPSSPGWLEYCDVFLLKVVDLSDHSNHSRKHYIVRPVSRYVLESCTFDDESNLAKCEN
jgi:hypothetical protein